MVNGLRPFCCGLSDCLSLSRSLSRLGVLTLFLLSWISSLDSVEKGFLRAGEAPFLRLLDEEDEEEEEENRLGRTVSEILDWPPRLLRSRH